MLMQVRCIICGKMLSDGPCLYCDGCSGWMCQECGIPAENIGEYTCPNCTTKLEQSTL
ncbi:MAG: hypothetical protein KGI00_04185 [Candidatus Micrarchaeota archaeon]|nr:hypothetical protein [Candidatus Micrarchaeota archaeon]MDE1849899.1 hypothetical protein [Candidatus Micrarchaeota archaeon]